MEAVSLGFEAALAAEALAQGDEFGDLDRLDVPRVEADEQVVGATAVDELIVGVFLVEQDALEDARVLEEANGAVDGGLGDTVAAALERFDELVGLEQAVELDDRVEDAGALGRVLETLGPQLPSEDGAQRLDDVKVAVGLAHLGHG